jgi:hypothetical protein
LTGKVVGHEGELIEYAKVSIITLDSIRIYTELTDESGNFIFSDVIAGQYNLTVQYFSEIIHTQFLNVEHDLNFDTIRIEAVLSIDEVLVTAKMKISKEPGKLVISNISASPLSKNRNSYDFLGSIPFINNASDGNTIKIKNKKEAKILINGKEVGDNETALNILKSTPAENIKKIEVITNPGSSQNADNQNGIINLIIKKSDEGLKASLSLGSSQSFYNSQNSNNSFSYSKNKVYLTTGVGLSNNRFKLKEKSVFKDYTNAQQTDIEQNSITNNKSISPFFNLNYDLTSKHFVGIQFNSSFKKNSVENNSNNRFTSINEGNLDSVNQSSIKNQNPNFEKFFLNANYTLRTDSIGSKLEFNFYNYFQDNPFKIINDFKRMNDTESIIQESDIKTYLYKILADYSHNFKNEDILKIGVSYNNGKTQNSLIYSEFNGVGYISDPLKSNSFKYIDNTTSAYFTYQKILGDLEAEVGMRWENYNGEGRSNNSTASQKNSYFFPSISLLFYLGETNEFSLDYRSSIIRPPYSYYNPNIYYTTASSYKKSNSNLLPILSNSLAFNYSFLNNYSFDIEYNFARNIFNDFDIIQPSGVIETITDNYGKGKVLWLDFTYNNHFIKKRWDFTATITYIYEKSSGIYNEIDLGFDNNEWGVVLKNYIYLNAKKNTILNLIYGYGSSNKSILGNMNAMHSLTFEFSKSLKKINFTAGAYDLLRPDLKLNVERSGNSFYKERKYYRTVYFRISYYFGNKKTKSVMNRHDTVNERMQ